MITILLIFDFILCLMATILDVLYYKKSKILYFFLNFIAFGGLIISTFVLLFLKRKKLCIAAGFLYLIGGVLLWIGKLVYSVIIMVEKDEGEIDFEEKYGKSLYLIVFIINTLTIFFRLGAVYLIKQIYKPICILEEYIHEKEHAEFVQSLGKENSPDDKLINDEEVSEDQLYEKDKNPFITGRNKKEDNEDEEIKLD